MNYDTDLKTLAADSGPDNELKEKTLREMAAARLEARHVRLRRTTIMAAMLSLILGFTAVGYATGLFSSPFAESFGNSEEQEVLIEEMWVPLNISDSAGGITVTAEAMLNDGKCLAILFKIVRDNGEPLLPANTVNLKGIVFGSIGSTDGTYFSVPRKGQQIDYLMYTPGDTEGYFIYEVSQVENAANVYTVYLGELQAWYKESTEPLVEGDPYTSWRFSISICPALESRRFAENTTFRKNGEEFLIEAIRVSPLSVTVDYTVTSDTPAHRGTEYSETLPNGTIGTGIDYHLAAFTDNINLALRLKDGTLIDLTTMTDLNGITNVMGHVEIKTDRKDNCFIVHRGGILPQIIPYEDMDAVIFNGVEYKINE